VAACVRKHCRSRMLKSEWSMRAKRSLNSFGLIALQSLATGG
jgi:hypothetical protein